MGNNASQIRRLSIAYNELNVRKSNTSQRANQQNLDEEFSDLILHEVKKDQDIRQQNLINRSMTPESTKKRPPLKYNQFLNDLIEDEFNELNDLIETDETGLERNILPSNKDVEDEDIDMIDDNELTFVGNPESVRMDVDYSTAGISESTPETPTPDLSNVDFTKVLPSETGFQQQFQSQPLQNATSITSQGSEQPVIQGAGVEGLVPVEIKWVDVLKENIQKVAIIGSFTNWRNIIRLKPSLNHQNEYVVTIRLPLGVHKLLYIINNEYRVSDQLPTATDQEGIFFNWFEVLDGLHLFNHYQNQPDRVVSASTKYDANIIQAAGQHEIGEIQRKSNSFLARISKEEPNVEHVEYMDREESDDQHELQQELLAQNQHQQHQNHHHPPSIHAPIHPISDKQHEPYSVLSENGSSSFLLQTTNKKVEYSSEIPEIFVNYNYFKSQNSDFELPEPPQLPAHLNNVLLNKISNSNQNPHSSSSLTPASGDLSSMPQMDSFKPPSASFMSELQSKRPPLRRADSSYYASNQEAYHLSIPNHVILNHLMTTSIRNDVLTVACITRYSGKFVTQIMHSPADAISNE